jgi:mono/diheme cytochrome c family protein
MKSKKQISVLRILGLASVFAALSGCNKVYELKGDAPDGYNQQVYEIVSNRCYECHANGVAEGGFDRIDNVQAMILAGDINPADPASSKIYRKIIGTWSNARMPFGGPYLSKAQSDAVLEWIGSLDTTDTPDPGACVIPSSLPPTATWTEVKGILETSCIGCHQDGEIADVNWVMGASNVAAYNQVVRDVLSPACSSAGACAPFDGSMVVANEPCQSRLYRRVSNGIYPSDHPSVFNVLAEQNEWNKMPKGGGDLSEGDQAIIYKWIDSGAEEI